MLADFPLSEAVMVREKSYEIKANWKLLIDNFLEYYHLPAIHPELTTVSLVENHHRLQGPVGTQTEESH